MKGIDFFHELLFECIKLSAVTEVFVSLPVIQCRQHLFHIGAGLVFGKALLHHVGNAYPDQVIHVAVCVSPVSKAPLAVILIERAVLIPADDRVFQRHPAALADQFPG